MACNVTDSQLWSWVDRQAPELAEHTANCPLCRQRAQRLQADLAGVAHAATPPDGFYPSEIGPYRVIRRIGEGGQGLVFEAEQRQPRRRVAIKVLKATRDSGQLRTFEREIESLARLQHAGIAAIYEAQHTTDGRPYFAMELIEGVPLNAYARDHASTPRERVELFRRVCEAVGYAHEHGVIHRDLKPSNILVDPNGQPHVLDFGLARSDESDITMTADLGESPRIVGTLPYISPEQAAGCAALDVRSDLYALGVMLYELLTNRLPHAVSRTMPVETLRAIRDEPVPRPSSVRPSIRGDLETIVLKTLEKEPHRRYATVAELDDDLQRYLDGRPILARPPSRAYQFSRLVARHRLAFSLAGALALSIIAFGIVATIQASRERSARTAADLEAQRAVREAERSARVQDFLEGLLVSADPRWTPHEMTVRDLLAEAEERVDRECAGDPQLEADLRTILGRTYQRYGVSVRAIPQYERALQIHRELHGPQDIRVAETSIQLAVHLAGRGRFDEGTRLYENGLDTLRAELGTRDDAVLGAMSGLAWHLVVAEDLPRATRIAQQVVDLRRSGESPAYAAALDQLADIQLRAGHLQQAEALYNEALSLRDRELGRPNREVAHSLRYLSAVRSAADEFEQAEALVREALAMFTALPNQKPNVLLTQLDLAEILESAGRRDEALAVLQDTMQQAADTYPDWHYIRLSSHRELGECLLRAGRHAQAEKHLETSLAGYRALSGDDHRIPRSLQATLTQLRGERAALQTPVPGRTEDPTP